MIQLPQAELFYAPYLPPKAQQTLLLIHGAGSSHLTWPAALRRLPDTAVYSLDLPGHGRSRPPGRHAVADYAQDVIDFITAMSLQNVFVLGHSLGGAIAQQVGLAAPPAVAGLILLGTGAKLRVSPQILAALEGEFTTAVDLLNQFYWGSQPDAALMTANRHSMLSCAPAVMLGDFVACNTFDLREKLPKISLPTLVISSQNDQMTPPKFGQYLAETLPNAEFTLLDEVGHMMMLEAPEAVARLVQRFLQ